MTVKELITRLHDFRGDTRIMICNPQEEDEEGNGVMYLIDSVELSEDIPEFAGEDPGEGAPTLPTLVIYGKV